MLDFANINFVITEPIPKEEIHNYEMTKQEWKTTNKLSRNTILNSLANELFDAYYHFDHARDIWDDLHSKYIFKDANSKDFCILNFCFSS